jgi:hypothetical protein
VPVTVAAHGTVLAGSLIAQDRYFAELVEGNPLMSDGHADGPWRISLRAVDGEIRFGAGSPAASSTDASNFRQLPAGVVVPRTPDAA